MRDGWMIDGVMDHVKIIWFERRVMAGILYLLSSALLHACTINGRGVVIPGRRPSG